MASQYLNKLSKDDRIKLEQKLWEQQNGKCFISGHPIDLKLDQADIDHIVPLRDNGKDFPSNFALALSHYNRSKQASDLRVARVLARLDKIRKNCAEEDRGPNLGDVLQYATGKPKDIRCTIENEQIKIVMDDGTNGSSVPIPLHTDKLSNMRYFFSVLPIHHLHHDDRINPRPIGANIRGLVEEFHRQRPQLHVALGWIESSTLPIARIRIFDGQHKAAAQILLGARELPVRVFVDPDIQVLLTTNTNAGTTLRQVAFDKSIQRKLGSEILYDRISRYKEQKGYPDDYDEFSERDLVEHFKGEQRAMMKYVVDAVRNGVTHSSENRLREYIEYSGKGYDKPISYSTIEKAVYSQLIYTKMLQTPWNYRSDFDENPRELEKSQIVRLMSVIAEKIYIRKYDDNVGTRRLEHKIQNGEDVPDSHLRAFRMAKEEILFCWIGYVRQTIEHYFANVGQLIDKDKLFQYPFPDQLWSNIENFVENLGGLPLWIDHEASSTVFGAKQTHAFWQTIFETGSSPSGHPVLAQPLNLIELISQP